MILNLSEAYFVKYNSVEPDHVYIYAKRKHDINVNILDTKC